MPLTVAFADSEVASVTHVGTALHIRLAAASATRADAGQAPVHGHVAAMEWVLHGASVDAPLHDLFGRLTSGRVEIAGRWLAEVALPSHAAGPVRIELAFANRSALAAVGTAFECRVDGAPRFSESLAC